MVESLLVLVIVAVCFASARLRLLVTREDSLLLALGALALGVLFSLLTGILYHGALWRTLGRRGALRPRWWWAPTSYHGALGPQERRQVMPWFYAGATSFTVVVAAALLVLATVWWQR